MRLTTCGLWVASLAIVEAANHSKGGWRNIRRQEIESQEEPQTEPQTIPSAQVDDDYVKTNKFEGLRLSFVTETTTEKVTETVRVQGTEAVTVTVTVSEPAVAVTQVAEAPPAVTVTEVITQLAEALPAVTITETITQEIPQLPVTVVSLVTESFPLPITVVNVITESIQQPPVTVVQVVTETVPQPPVTVTEQVTIGKTASAVTVTEEAPRQTLSSATVTKTKTVTESCEAPINGVSTIPIANNAKPTTTFAVDPLAQSLILDDVETTTSIVPEPSMGNNLTLGPSEDQEPASQPTDLVNSINLGGLGPDATADADSAVETAAPDSGRAKSRVPIDVEGLTLSSVLDLGNLAGGGGFLRARATDAP